MNCKYYISATFIALLFLISSCSFVDYINDDSIYISLVNNNFVDKEIRKGTPLTFELQNSSFSPDFPCYDLSREVYLDDKKIDLPQDTSASYGISLQVSINTDNLQAGEHVVKVKVFGCDQFESTKLFKFSLTDSDPPVAKILKTRVMLEPGVDKLKIFVHYASTTTPVQTLKLYNSKTLSHNYDELLDSVVNINKLEGDTSLSIYLDVREDQYNLFIKVSDNISSIYTDSLKYDYKFWITENTITNNTTWTSNKGPYMVTHTIHIKGATLTIEPGAVIRFGNDGKIVVDDDALSSIVAEGNVSDQIHFLIQYGKSNGIELNSASTFKHCNIKTGGIIKVNNTDLSLENSKVDSLMLDKDSKFASCINNTIDYLSISAAQQNTIGNNNTITKLDITSKK